MMFTLSRTLRLPILPRATVPQSLFSTISHLNSPHFSTVAAKKKKKRHSHRRNDSIKSELELQQLEEDYTFRPIQEAKNRTIMPAIKINVEEDADILQSLALEEDQMPQMQLENDESQQYEDTSRLYTQSEKFNFFELAGYEYFPTDDSRSELPMFLTPEQREMVAQALMISGQMPSSSYFYSSSEEDRDFATLMQIQNSVDGMRDAKRRMLEEVDEDADADAAIAKELQESEDRKNLIESFHHKIHKQTPRSATPNKFEHEEAHEEEPTFASQKEIEEKLFALSGSWMPSQGNTLNNYHLSGSTILSSPFWGGLNSSSVDDEEETPHLTVERSLEVDENFNTLKAYELASSSAYYESLSLQEQLTIDRHNERMLFLVGNMDAILPLGRYHQTREL